MNQRLLKNGENINSQNITLFCFPFAGGGASAYNSWVQKMKDTITVCPIQLPGREERIMEKPYHNMTDMLDELEETIWENIRGPYAFWGHSMGGKIAYELEKRMEKRGKTARCFMVSGSRIPSIPEPNPIYHLPDDEFKKVLGRFEGTPKEILENQELLDFFLPMLRADFTMDETYYDRDHINTLDGADTLRSFLIENSFRYVVMPETEIVKDIDSIAYIIFTSGTTGIPKQ